MKLILYLSILSFIFFTYSCKKELVGEEILFEKWDHSPNAQAFRDALNANMGTILISTQSSKMSFGQLVELANNCNGSNQENARDSDSEKCQIALKMVKVIEYSKLVANKARKTNPEIWDYEQVWAKYVTMYSPKSNEILKIRNDNR